MFITCNASPGEILSQLIFLGRSRPDATKKFKLLAHNNDLCPTFHDKVETILKSYNRHKTSALDIQGFRDNGADILFTFEDEDGKKDAVALQVKSQKEIEDDIKRPKGQVSLVRDLKAQRTEAQSKHRISMYYILLCCDIDLHRDYVRKVAAEFTSLDDVKIVTPQHALYFYDLDHADIAANCARILCRTDFVVRKARDELNDLNPAHRRILIGSIVSHLEGTLTLSIDDVHSFAAPIFLPDDGQLIDQADDAVQALMWDRFFETIDGEKFTVDATNYPALRALYFDLNVRHGLTSDSAFKYLLTITESLFVGEDDTVEI